MKICEINGFDATGLMVRTSNANEMDGSTAQIGKLWESFYKNVAPKLNENSKVYGLYTNYESDVSGLFDVIACADTLESENIEGAVKHSVPAGKYLTFSATGEMPQVVIGLWEDVWKYFQSDDCEHERAYSTDFEYYKSQNEVEVFIGVKS